MQRKNIPSYIVAACVILLCLLLWICLDAGDTEKPVDPGETDWQPSFNSSNTTESSPTGTLPEGSVPVQYQEKIRISGSILWNDGEDQDGKRPDSLTVTLLANGIPLRQITVTAGEGWHWEATELDKYAEGRLILYAVICDGVEGYATTADGLDMTHTHTPEKTQITGSLIWNDQENQDGLRPESVTVYLMAGGERKASQTVSARQNWTWRFAETDCYANGQPVAYTVAVEPMEGYTPEYSGNDVIVTHEIGKTEVTGSLIWDDQNDRDGVRPEYVTVHLMAVDRVLATQTIGATENWHWCFAELDRYADGQMVMYTVRVETPAGYTVENSGWNVVASHIPQRGDVSGSILWDDDNDRDGKRPESVTVQLLADGQVVAVRTVTALDNWQWIVEDLDMYAEGQLISYTITQEAPAEYTRQIQGMVVTNRYMPETTEITGSISWSDGNDQDGKRPENVTIYLLANGEKVASMTVNAAQQWQWCFAQMYVYAGGTPVAYTIQQETIENYTVSYDGDRIVNVYAPEKTQVSGFISWNDGADQDGKRPASITVHVYADEERKTSQTVTAESGWAWNFTQLDKYWQGQAVRYTVVVEAVEGYDLAYEENCVICSRQPEKTTVSGSILWEDADDQDGKRPGRVTVSLYANGEKVAEATATKEQAWAWSFAGLDRYAGGKQIGYTVAVEAISGYSIKVEHLAVTAIHIPQKKDLSVQILWDDAADQDGKRPAGVTVYLWADGQKAATKTAMAANGWDCRFEGLDVYQNGEKIVYTVTQDTPEGYVLTVDGLQLTNTHTTEKTQVSGVAIWNDDDDRAGKRPASIRVDLFANGEKITSQTVTAAQQWCWAFTDLDAYDRGKKIVYTITAQTVEDYTAAISGYDVTYAYDPGKIQVSVSVSWKDADDQDGKRPGSVTVHLWADGVKVASRSVTAADGWKWTFRDMDEYANDKLITYTLTQDAVSGYTTAADGLQLTNSHTPEKTKVEVTVTWNDANDQDGKRPQKVKVYLLANGAQVASKELTAGGNWAGSFQNLDKYSKGKKIVYSVQANAVNDYTVAVDGTKVTYSHTPLAPLFSIVLRPEASGEQVKSNDSAIIDYSHTNDGYVMIQYTAEATVRLKVQLLGPTTTYSYDLRPGQWEVFPLSDGEGTYKIRILENVVDNRYATVLSLSTTVSMEDSFAPFLRPNQYVDYADAVKTVEKGAELCRGLTTDLEKIDAIYKYVVDTFTYDREKANTVKSDYLPVLDQVLAEKKGICSDYAAVMTAMLRSQGIPCKLVVGYLKTESHAWISIWTEETGWVDGNIYFDGTSWKRMDPTVASSRGHTQSAVDYIGNDANYTSNYYY